MIGFPIIDALHTQATRKSTLTSALPTMYVIITPYFWGDMYPKYVTLKLYLYKNENNKMNRFIPVK